ncbi:MAG: hypothetical protein Q9163_002127 [Psora crenata]
MVYRCVCIFIPQILKRPWQTLRGKNKAPSAEAPIRFAPYPEEPPPPPLELLDCRQQYEVALLHRQYLPHPRDKDTPLRTLYRLYEAIVLDWTIGMRNEIEYFFRKHQWPVHEIPDPRDDNPERYAVLSCIPALLVDAFNRNIKLGLPRNAPAVMNDDEIDEVQLKPKWYECVPDWANRVPPLTETLRLPHHKDPLGRGSTALDVIEDASDERASEAFKEKNILVWEPHIYFI